MSQARQLAGEWCEKGADVTFRTNQLPPITPGLVLPNHFGPDLIDGLGTGGAVDYLMDRFANRPVTGCTFN
jgi:hypothetical protein